MNKLQISPASLHDLQEIAGLLRAEDVEEIKAATGKTAVEVLVGGFGFGDSFIARTAAGNPVAVFGISPHPFYQQGKAAVVWFLATPEVNKVSREVIRQARGIIAEWRKEWNLLGNWAWSRNHMHLKWIRLMGFEFVGNPTSINNHQFRGFAIRGKGTPPREYKRLLIGCGFTGDPCVTQ